ncbi:MAG: ABC transporter substrate-binding protein [Proteobacteria bacterium]|nr:ABC transporter substrate-binding protein [Pseudomonadota bacterium]
MKRSILRIICFTSAFLIMSSCFEQEPIKIGFVSGLSGRRSELGVSSRNSVHMAIEELNANGGINGRSVQLIIKDNKSDPQTNMRVITELVDEGVVAIIGPSMSQMAETTMAATDQKNVLVFSPTISTDELSDKDDHFIRIMPAVSLQAIKTTEVILNDKINSAAVVYDSSNQKYSEPIYLLFKKTFTEKGGIITYVDNLKEGRNRNLLNMARKINKSSAESLVLITSGIDAAAICQQIRKLNKSIKFYGVYWTKTGSLVERGGRSVEGMTIVAAYEAKPRSARYVQFFSDYRERYKIDPRFNSIFAYEAALILIYGLKHSDKIDGESLKRTILNKSTFEGLEETLTLNRFGDVLRKDMAVVIENGKFKRKRE